MEKIFTSAESKVPAVGRVPESPVERNIVLTPAAFENAIKSAVSAALGQLNLDNCTASQQVALPKDEEEEPPDENFLISPSISEGENDMPKRYREQVQIGKEKDGKPIYAWVVGKDKQDLFINIAKKLIEYGMLGKMEGLPEVKKQPKTPLFRGYAENWWKTYKLPKLRKTTQNSYRNLLDRHIYPFFGDMRLEDINTSVIQTYYNECADFSKSTVHQMAVVLHQIFDLAVEDGYMTFNPTESKRLSMTQKAKHREPLTDDEAKEILSNLGVLEPQERMLIGLLMLTGMRRGETLAIRWENIEWDRKLIHVEHAVTFDNNQPVVGQTKSDAGVRSIPLDPRLEAILRPEKQPEGFIIGDGEKPLTERTFTRLWGRIGKKIDLHGATPHIFRHTYITMAASSGIDVKTLQAIAGHADIKMTMERYAHKREEKVVEAGSLISKVWEEL